MPTGNHRNPAVLGLHLGDQRRLFLWRPLPTALDPRSSYDLAIHSNGLLLDVQKEPASLTTPPSATSGPTVQAGRLLAKNGAASNIAPGIGVGGFSR